MTAPSVTVQSEVVISALNSVLAAGSNLKPATQRVAQRWKGLSLLSFRTSKDPHGKPWKPVLRAGGQPLVDTGRLRNSLTTRATGLTAEVGTNVLYAAVHQFGATIKPVKAKALRFQLNGQWFTRKQVKIPARPFLPTTTIPASYENAAVKVVSNYLSGAAA